MPCQLEYRSVSRSSVTYGTVKQLPHNRNGLWFIGRETIESDAFTDLQENYGPLAIGACVAVEKRGNRARRIMTVRSTAAWGRPLPSASCGSGARTMQRSSAVALTLSVAAHALLLWAWHAPGQDSTELRAPPDFRFWIERPADRDVASDDVGQLAHSTANRVPRPSSAPESKKQALPDATTAEPVAASNLGDTPITVADVPPEPPASEVSDTADAEVISVIAASGTTMPSAERQMLSSRVKAWSQSFQGAQLLGTRVTWQESGQRYTAALQRVPASSPTDIERVLVDLETQQDGRLLKSRMQMKRLAFSHFNQLVDHWDTDVQLHDDEIVGRFHSNTKLIVGWDRDAAPRFLGPVTTAARSIDITDAVHPRAWREIFRGGVEMGAQRIVLRRYDYGFAQDARAVPTPTQSFAAATELVFEADGRIRWRAADSADPLRTVDVGSGAVFLTGGPGVTLFVSGTVRGTVLVYSPQDIVIVGSLRYARDPRENPQSRDYLGLAADNDVVVAGSDRTGPGDLQIDAAIYARRRFEVRDFETRRQGTLVVYGSLSAGSLSATEPRYATRVEFDPRFESTRPPGFPITDRYELESWDGLWTPAEGLAPP